MQYVDRNGEPFEGTPEEFAKHQEKLRKRKDRASRPKPLSLPFPQGTADALARVMAACGDRFDDPRDFLAFQIHRLDALRDSPEFVQQTTRTVRVTGLAKYLEQLGAPVPSEQEEDEAEWQS